MKKYEQKICKPYTRIKSNVHLDVVCLCMCMRVHWIKSNTVSSRYRLDIPVALHLIRSAFINLEDQYTIVSKFRIDSFCWLCVAGKNFAYFEKQK